MKFVAFFPKNERFNLQTKKFKHSQKVEINTNKRQIIKKYQKLLVLKNYFV